MRALDTAIYSRMNAATALTNLLAGTTSIYSMMAPPNAALPYVVFNVQGGGDRTITSVDIKDVVVQVRGVGRTPEQSKADVAEIDEQCRTLFHRHALSVSDWNTIWMAREEDIEFAENEENADTTYWHVGGLYRFIANKSGA